MLDNKTLEFIKLLPVHHEAVLEHLRNTFFADEPLNKGTKLCQRGEGHPELEEVVIDTFKDDISIVAVTKDGDVAGVVLNGWLYKGEVEKSRQKLKYCKDDRFRTIFTLLYDENLKVDLFSQFSVEKMFEVRILSVDSRFRGQGIAKKLFEESEKLARELGSKIIKADCTGLFSQKITASLGYTVCHEKYYDKYLNDQGERIIPVEQPHEKLQVKYKLLE
uniref:aralkylamine N-acetyltransferase n=1 Tax=Culicoides sonorensis TaxID=179676 RepID=A0A336M9Y0_CULSO